MKTFISSLSFLQINILLIILHGLVVLSLNLFYWRLDIYPFYKWNMFNEPRDHYIDYAVLLKAVDGAPLELDLYSNRQRFLWHQRRQIYFTIENLGRFFEREQLSDSFLAKERKLMSEAFFRATSVDYDLLRRRYETVSFLKHREFTFQQKMVARSCQRASLQDDFQCRSREVPDGV